MQVLYVDNDKLVSNSMEQMLQQEGHSCDATTRGADAVTLAKRNHYDIIVLEVMLPDVSGFEVVDRLRAEGIETPFLFQTSLENHETLDDILPVAHEEVLIKPLGSDVLFERVDAAMSRAKTNGEAAPVEPPDREYEGPERRQEQRVETTKTAEIVHERGARDCVILNLSDGGAAIRLPHNFLACPSTFTLRFESGRSRRCRVRWRVQDSIGVEYTDD